MAEVAKSAPQNVSKPNVSHKHSTFPIEYSSFDTHQFGYIRPHFCIKGISADTHRHRPVVKSSSFSLKAPLMQDVFRRLSYFKVNLDAVLPLNAEKIYTNPVIGQDVPVDANCVIENGFDRLFNSFSSVFSYARTTYATTPNAANATLVLKALIFGELFYSRGSLLASLGAHLYNQCIIELGGTRFDFDDYFDLLCGRVLTAIGNNTVTVLIDGVNYLLDPSFNSSISLYIANRITFRDFLCMIRETSDWSFDSSADSIFNSVGLFPPTTFTGVYSADAPFNPQRVLSYQLACAEFFSNDKIDYIYSAELFRQYIGDLLCTIIDTYFGTNLWPQNFTMNGVKYQYDYLSGHYFAYILDFVINNPNYFFLEILQYFISSFGLKRSLRYKDYFVGSRSYPLAVGDVNVNVNSNLVNVVDITRKIQIQRFLNAVNHSGRKLSNYVKTLFGVDIHQDRHVPQWLADITENVYTSEVENTGSAQLSDSQSVTARFTSNSSNKELEFGVDVESVIIGVTTYDIERAFINSIDRDFFIKDRFDMFLPELQFVGDQPVYKQELNAADISSFGSPFSYQFRDQQWKLIFSRASGGFVGKLPGYCFINRPFGYYVNQINPDFIRSFPTEFDDFFVSLTGYSLGNYWHFIVWTKNFDIASRAMIANPVILE